MKRAIFGAGANGRLFLQGMRESGMEIDAFIDQQAQADQLDGVPLLRPEAIEEKEEWQLFCAIFPHSLAKPSYDRHLHTEARVEQLGFSNVVGFAETLIQFPAIIQGYFERHYLWMHADPEEMLNSAAIERLSTLLSDQQSVQLLEQWVAWRATQSMQYYIHPDGQCEYFPEDIPRLFSQQPLRFIDCGAYTGDTVEDLYALWRGEIESVTCFEPDLDNVQQLQQTLAQLQRTADQGCFYLYPCGVSSQTEILSFSSGQGSSSTMVMGEESDMNRIEVPVVSLDQTVGLSAPNYIKMDVEGAELKALQGAKEMIASPHAPALAICLYHKPEDLWEIPLYLHQLQPNYKMYLRCHDHLGLSTVLYCHL